MFNNRSFYLVVVMAIVVVTACTPQVTAATVIAPTPSTESNPADRFAGTWTGAMSMTEDPTVSAIAVVTIPTGCSVNQICGDALNTANGCRWEMTLTAVHDDTFEYTYSKTLEGDCEALGSGTMTLNPDGILFREHDFPDFTITGTLTRE